MFATNIAVMYGKNKEPDAGSLLAELAGSIPDFNHSVDVYISHIGEYEIFNPFLNGFHSGTTEMSPDHYSFSLIKQ